MIGVDSCGNGAWNRNGEDYEEPSVDEGRHPDAKDTRAREREGECDRAKAEAELCSDPAEGMDTWYRARESSEEEEVRENCPEKNSCSHDAKSKHARTLAPSSSNENGFPMRCTPGSRRPWWTIALRV
jgi:hypothetical protein